jgi:DNA end-binding protein Ku
MSLHMIHQPTGERVRYQRVVPDIGPVDNDDIVKGFEFERGRYVTLTEEELSAIKVESKHTISLVRFVDAHEIDPIYFDRPYFVAPDTELAEEPFVVLRDALKSARKTALGQVTLSGKEHIAAIRPCGRGLILETLRYADEVRTANKVFDEIPDIHADDEQVELAQLLIDKKSGPFDPHEFKDHQQEVLRAMIEAKLHDRPAALKGEERKGSAKVVNLMDALRRSVDEAEQAGGAQPPKRTAAKEGGGGGTRRTRASGTKPARSKQARDEEDGDGEAHRDAPPDPAPARRRGGRSRKTA